MLLSGAAPGAAQRIDDVRLVTLTTANGPKAREVVFGELNEAASRQR